MAKESSKRTVYFGTSIYSIAKVIYFGGFYLLDIEYMEAAKYTFRLGRFHSYFLGTSIVSKLER